MKEVKVDQKRKWPWRKLRTVLVGDDEGGDGGQGGLEKKMAQIESYFG